MVKTEWALCPIVSKNTKMVVEYGKQRRNNDFYVKTVWYPGAIPFFTGCEMPKRQKGDHCEGEYKKYS